MEYLDGLDLETLVERHGPLAPERAVHLLAQACDSLEEAHTRQLIHRDIKPANLIVGCLGPQCDFVKLLDFGLVKTEDKPGDAMLSREGQFTGTPAYASPEQAMGEADVDARSDIYALGCVGYWLLTGARVFDADTAMKVAIAHATEAPEPPSTRTELDVPECVDEIILRCLAKDPADRYQSARELGRTLRACPVADPWSAEAAEGWWRAHDPSGVQGAA